jgi:DNA-binding response OmpR family regulator
MRVLVIEDDRKVASFIQTGLAQEGYSVDLLNDGENAGEQARVIDYDAVVLDLMLPGRSGFQVLRDIRARKASLPVIILTREIWGIRDLGNWRFRDLGSWGVGELGS